MSDESTPTPVWRRYALTAAKLAVSIVLLAVLFTRVDAAQLWRGARQASLAWLACAIFLQGVNVVASSWRWHILLHAQAIHVRFSKLVGSILVASFFNNFLPSNIGGDVI